MMPKYICDAFNALCTELGLECLITMDPRAYDMNYAFKNRGPHTVALFTDDWFELVPPNGDITIKMPHDDSPWMAVWDEPLSVELIRHLRDQLCSTAIKPHGNPPVYWIDELTERDLRNE